MSTRDSTPSGRQAFCDETGLAAGDLRDLTGGNALFANLLPVTWGNVIGGSLMVGVVYWAVYLRRRQSPDDGRHVTA